MTTKPATFPTRGTYEPAGMIEHPDLVCPGCGAGPVLQKPEGGSFSYSCARYWRGTHGECWVIASPRSRFEPAPAPALTLF